MRNSNRVQIHYHHVKIVVFLKFNGREECSEEIADVENVGGLDSGERFHKIFTLIFG